MTADFPIFCARHAVIGFDCHLVCYDGKGPSFLDARYLDFVLFGTGFPLFFSEGGGREILCCDKRITLVINQAAERNALLLAQSRDPGGNSSPN